MWNIKGGELVLILFRPLTDPQYRSTDWAFMMMMMTMMIMMMMLLLMMMMMMMTMTMMMMLMMMMTKSFSLLLQNLFLQLYKIFIFFYIRLFWQNLYLFLTKYLSLFCFALKSVLDAPVTKGRLMCSTQCSLSENFLKWDISRKTRVFIFTKYCSELLYLN